MPLVQQDILQDDSNDKRALISESVTAIRIDIQLAEEEPDQHAVCMIPEVSLTTTI
jgi:hypothetical protein